jgi:hypothetical protein
MAELKASESEADSDSESNPEGGKQIIDVEPSATVATTKVWPSEPEEPEEGEHLFHSQMWVKGALLHHDVYESRPRSVIITLGRQMYRIPEVASPTAISLISAKQWSKVISQNEKFVFFVFRAHGKQKVAATSVAYTYSLSLHHNQVDRIVE